MKQQEKKTAQPLPEEKIRRVLQKVDAVAASQVSQEDPQGSYTGVPVLPGEMPMQDADDL